jgi:hypothetical protein
MEFPLYYVYVHRIKSNNKIFYVGIGSHNQGYGRSKNTKLRNKYWHEIVNKNDFIVEIISEKLTKWDAYGLERVIINLLGRKKIDKNGILCNIQ